MTESNDIYWTEAYDKESGIWVQNWKFPKNYWPITVKGREVWERADWPTSLNRKLKLIGIWTFLGHDRGDQAESDINIDTYTGIPLVQRSEHRIFTDYDADVYYDLRHLNICAQTLRIWLKSAATTDGSVRYHVVIRVLGREKT